MVASPKLSGALPAGAKPARAPVEPDLAGNRTPSRNPARGPAVGPAPTIERISARPQLCFVIDGDASIRQFLSLVLQGSGIDTEEFADSHALRAALAQRMPDIVFLDVRAETSEAAECLAALGAAGYRGPVQLTLSRGAKHLTQIQTIGKQQHLHLLPVLRKPFETSVIVKMLQDQKLGQRPALAGRVDLGEALAKNWIEFWYQPKIDLRKKQLIGVEAFARARHPTNGVLLPNAFMPGAQEPTVNALSELALTQSLNASQKFVKLGVNLRLSVNLPVSALVKLPLIEIV